MIWWERGHTGREPLQQSTYLGSGPSCNPCLSLNSPIPYLYSCTHPYMQTYLHAHTQVHMHTYTHVHTHAHIAQLQSCDHPGAASAPLGSEKSPSQEEFEDPGLGSQGLWEQVIAPDQHPEDPWILGSLSLSSATPICTTSPFLLF